MNQDLERDALAETQQLITKLRGVLTTHITSEWVKPDADQKRVQRLRSERDTLLDLRENIGQKHISEIQLLKSEIEDRLESLT